MRLAYKLAVGAVAGLVGLSACSSPPYSDTNYWDAACTTVDAPFYVQPDGVCAAGSPEAIWRYARVSELDEDDAKVVAMPVDDDYLEQTGEDDAQQDYLEDEDDSSWVFWSSSNRRKPPKTVVVAQTRTESPRVTTRSTPTTTRSATPTRTSTKRR